ncbi:MAG TPA: hypothetical protein VET65_03755 [Candidatus Limnocylindrales bacterium]|nr:hypothetical protein [Candidatus Limnocylindrales bacterium]
MAVEAVGAPGPKPSAQASPGRAWWIEPALTVLAYSAFVVYATWAVFNGKTAYAAPYLSPFDSPSFGVLRLPTGYLLPLLAAIPLALRATCYYYRKSYYRAFFWDPPACAIAEVRKRRYRGETRFPFVLSNLHRYALILTVLVTIVLWADVVRAFDFKGHFGIGLGTVIMLVNVVLLTLYTGTCHSLRYLAGGSVDCYSCARAGRLRHRISSLLNRLNPQHGAWAWYSMFSVGLTDVYIRLLQSGVLQDPRWILHP